VTGEIDMENNDKQTTTEMKVGNIAFTVISECSPTATETVEQKVKRLINQHILDKEKLSSTFDNQVAMS
jgi:hypothetical protein